MFRASNWIPKPWLAFLLGLIAQPAGLLYSGAPKLAFGYFTALVVALIFNLTILRGNTLGALLVLVVMPLACAIHSYRLARIFKSALNRPAYSKLHVIVVIYAAVIGLYGMFNVFLYQPVRIVNRGMTPTIPPDSLVVARKWGYGHYKAFGHTIFQAKVTSPLQRGDLIIFVLATEDEINQVSRLIGLPGDTISYHDNVLSINGVIVVQQSEGEYFDKALFFLKIFRESIGNKDYLVAFGDPARLAVPNKGALNFSHKEYCQYDSSGLTCKVPEHNYFVLSDNRDNSMDSRIRGFVSEENIVGVVSYVLQQNAPKKLDLSGFAN